MSTQNLPVAYHYPDSVETACALAKQYGDNARFVAGGTDLLLEMERVKYHPHALIDLTRIPALRQLTIADGHASIGAAVTYSELLGHAPLCAAIPLLAKAVRTIGGVQVRNVGTLAGNIANASPAADTLPVLYVLNARVHTALAERTRTLALDEFILGVRKIALEPGELITHVTLDLPGPNWYGSFDKLGIRRAMAIAVASLAVLVQHQGGCVQQARLALGAVAPTVIRLQGVEALLAGSDLGEAAIAEAARLAEAAARPIDDVRSTASYRVMAVGGLVHRALHALQDEIAAGR